MNDFCDFESLKVLEKDNEFMAMLCGVSDQDLYGQGAVSDG